MPLILREECPEFSRGIWHLTETETDLRELLEPIAPVLPPATHPEKRRQQLAARLVYYALSNHTRPLGTDDRHAPVPESGFVSLSHSDEYAAAIFSPSRRVAIDVEKTDFERPLTVSRMFMNVEEKKHLQELPFPENYFYFYKVWCIKECLFKLLNDRIREISFVRHLYTAPGTEKHTFIAGCNRPDLTFEGTAVWHLLTTGYMTAFLSE